MLSHILQTYYLLQLTNLLYKAPYIFTPYSRMVARTNQDDYVEIFRGSGCWSKIGRRGGMQQLSLDYGCPNVGLVVHEFGHALGKA